MARDAIRWSSDVMKYCSDGRDLTRRLTFAGAASNLNRRGVIRIFGLSAYESLLHGSTGRAFHWLLQYVSRMAPVKRQSTCFHTTGRLTRPEPRLFDHPFQRKLQRSYRKMSDADFTRKVTSVIYRSVSVPRMKFKMSKSLVSCYALSPLRHSNYSH